jgi:hypothetical protein
MPKPHYTQTGVLIFGLTIEILEIVGFGLGFYSIINLPVSNMKNDLSHVVDNSTKSVMAIKDDLRLMVHSSITSRVVGFWALACILLAFVLRTIVRRAIRIY